MGVFHKLCFFCQLKRGLLVTRLPIEDSKKELTIVNLHLEAYDSGEGKRQQTEILINFLLEEYSKGNYCVAGGDFNQTFPTIDNSRYPILDDSHFSPGSLDADLLPEGWTFAADGDIPTSRLNNQPYNPASPNTQHYVLDGFILSPNVELLSVQTLDGGFRYSDHNPVRLEIRLLAEEPSL